MNEYLLFLIPAAMLLVLVIFLLRGSLSLKVPHALTDDLFNKTVTWEFIPLGSDTFLLGTARWWVKYCKEEDRITIRFANREGDARPQWMDSWEYELDGQPKSSDSRAKNVLERVLLFQDFLALGQGMFLQPLTRITLSI